MCCCPDASTLKCHLPHPVEDLRGLGGGQDGRWKAGRKQARSGRRQELDVRRQGLRHGDTGLVEGGDFLVLTSLPACGILVHASILDGPSTSR